MSRQRHDSKRSDNRSTSSAPQQRRQTQKATQTAANGVAGARAKRASSRSPQLVIPEATTANRITTSKGAKVAHATKSKTKTATTTTARTTTPRTTTPKVASKPRVEKQAATTAHAPQQAQLAPVIAPVGDEVIGETSALAQMPELPEIPETPGTPEPEIPETPETTDVPEIPETPETPESPETPEIPEVPETPEIPEAPETPEIPEVPETPEPPEQPEEPPEEPVEPTEPDNPAVQASETLESIAQPRPERRMPTLAVMAHLRRDAEASAEEPATNSDPRTAAAMTNGVTAANGGADGASSADVAKPAQATTLTDTLLRRKRRGKTAEHAVSSKASAASTAEAAAPAERAQSGKGPAPAAQQTSIITRPVAARYSNRRRRVPRAPDLIWENDPHLPDLPWPLRRQRGNRPQPLPPADLLIPVIVFHYCVLGILGLLAALFGASSESVTSAPGSWMLAGALIAGLGGVSAYMLGESATSRQYAPYALLASQLGLLAWAMILLGPRPSLLALAPALIEIMLLIGGTSLASMLTIGALVIYAIFAGLSVSVGLAPVVSLDPASAVMLDVVCIVVGLLAALWLLLAIQAGRERALAIARARRHEADVLRNLVTQFRQEVQDDTGKLESALLQALKGHGISAIPTEGMYRLLAETIMDTASRLEVLQRDREERLRLEGALRVIIRAVERQWLGIEPEWPEHTGTAIDELIALLRTPRLDLTYQQESQSPSITPRLIPIPSVSVERDTPPPTPISRPLSGASWLSPRRRARRPDLYPVPSADEDLPSSDEADEHTGNSSLWSMRDFQPTPDEP